MEIYLLHVILLPFLKLIFNRRTFIFSACFVLFLIIALRADDLGIDAPAYIRHFQRISGVSFIQMLKGFGIIQRLRVDNADLFDTGYAFVTWIFAAGLGTSFHAFIVFLGLVNAYSVYRFFLHYSESPCLAMFMYISLGGIFSYFYILRRMLALSVWLFAYPAIEEKKYLKAFSLTFIAFLCHRSTIMFPVLFFLQQIKMTRKIFLSAFVAAIMLFILTPFLLRGLLFRILVTFDKGNYINTFRFQVVNLYFILIASAIAIYFAADFSKIQTPKNNILCWVFLLFIAAQSMNAHFGIFSLINNQLTLVTSIFLTNIISEHHDRTTRRFLYIAASVALFIYYQRTLAARLLNPLSGVPYRSIFN